MNINILYKIGIIAFFASLLMSCEEPYEPPTVSENQQFVVEGFIEAGPEAGPTIVTLTKSIPFISKVDRATFESIFVKDAIVGISNGTKTVQLTQLCLNQLPPEIRKQAAEALGLNADSLQSDICVFIDILNEMPGEIGGKYDLTVKVDGQTLTATTTIPPHVKIDSIRWSEPPGEPNDTLARLWVTIQDRVQPDFYRTLIGESDTDLRADFNSVVDDGLFNGKKFEFPLQKPTRRGDPNFDVDTQGLFKRGDDVVIKWSNIDKAHYDFWNTRDFAANSGGPFSSYTRIKTNIKGGLGIWGGYSVSYYRMKVPKK